MKNLKYLLSLIFIIIPTQIYAYTGDAGILGGIGSSATKSAAERLRTGDVHIDDIPGILTFLIDTLMGLAGTIAVIFIIIGAYKIAIGGISNDKSKGKETIILALSGFILASLSWVILKIIIDNFS